MGEALKMGECPVGVMKERNVDMFGTQLAE